VDSAKRNYRLIRRAYSCLNKKKFQEAIAILEGVLSSGAGGVYVLLLLSVAYLYTDQFGKLARFITKMKEKNPGYLPLIQLEAFLKIKSVARHEDALNLYLDLTAKYPGDPHIRRGMELLDDARDFPSFQKNALLQDFVHILRPPRELKKIAKKTAYTDTLSQRGQTSYRHARYFPGPYFIVIGIAAFLVLAIAAAWYVIDPDFYRTALMRLGRNKDFSAIDMISVSGLDYDIIKNMKRDRVPVYYQSARRMTEDFNRARRLIKSEKYNEALLLLNGLYHSNINFVVKEKVDFLIKFVIGLEDREFADVPYRTVIQKRYLYRGYAVRWKGTAGKVRERGESMSFVLNVDAGDGKGQGAADVFSDRAVQGLKQGSSVRVEGIIADFIGKDKTAYITAKNVKVLVKQR
jgi:tetratricopeptide (TPR) repeat protein